MKFQIGQVAIKVSAQEWIAVVFPVGEYMVAIKAEAFKEPQPNSALVTTEIYHKDDTLVKVAVQKMME